MFQALATLPVGEAIAVLRFAIGFAVMTSKTGGIHYTNGVCFDFVGDKLNIVATDGHCLLVYPLDLTGESTTRRVLVDASYLKRFIAWAKGEREHSTVAIGFRDNRFTLELKSGGPLFPGVDQGDGVSYWNLPVIDVKFPDYERVLSNELFDRPNFRTAFNYELLAKMFSNLPKFGSREHVATTLRLFGDGKELPSAEALKLTTISEVNPIGFKVASNDGIRAVLMPVRLD